MQWQVTFSYIKQIKAVTKADISCLTRIRNNDKNKHYWKTDLWDLFLNPSKLY